ncbi:hypothetical protein VTL71DRAFT_1910 [Oculimacula yallundae]|uniref:Uncharacterized protein n=1 Tax=Oculimacula yallundae TaxID=86028 RepID=A0ABR4CC33_9HELO
MFLSTEYLLALLAQRSWNGLALHLVVIAVAKVDMKREKERDARRSNAEAVQPGSDDAATAYVTCLVIVFGGGKAYLRKAGSLGGDRCGYITVKSHIRAPGSYIALNRQLKRTINWN